MNRGLRITVASVARRSAYLTGYFSSTSLRVSA